MINKKYQLLSTDCLLEYPKKQPCIYNIEDYLSLLESVTTKNCFVFIQNVEENSTYSNFYQGNGLRVNSYLNNSVYRQSHLPSYKNVFLI